MNYPPPVFIPAARRTAIGRLCVETGWRLEEVDAVEINEVFAAQVLGCARELSLDARKLNQRGGNSH